MSSTTSLIKNVIAPSPRYLMRLVLLEELVNLLPLAPASFLEIGPGMGDVSHYLVNRYPDIQGDIIDISSDSIDIARQRMQDHANLSFSVADFNTIPGHEKYDVIIACEVFEHIDDDNAAFDAVYRLLKQGGHFIFSAPAFMSKWGPADQYGGHVRRYERDPLLSQFERHYFEVINFWSYGFPLTNLISPISKLYYHFAQKNSPQSKLNATKRSGVERRLAKKIKFLPYSLLMQPFFVCQDAVKTLNMGDGYIVLAKKRLVD